MPTVTNGIGTWYYGKSNIHKCYGTCEFCGGFHELVSFDTTLYFMIFYIPIIPLGKKRVLHQCSGCKRHRVMKLKIWEDSKRKALDEAPREFKLKPDNADAAKKLIATAVYYQDENLLIENANQIKRYHSKDDDIMQGLGSAFSYFMKQKDAEECYRTSLAVKDNIATREYLADCLIRQLRPDEAVNYLQHILNNRDLARVGILYVLIECYQAVGNHSAALNLVNQCYSIFPELAKDKSLKKYKKISEKNLTSNKKIKSPNIIDESGKLSTMQGGSSASALISKLIGPIIIIAIIGFFLYGSYRAGEKRQIYLVNGLDKPYKIKINGQEQILPSNRELPINIKEGDISVEVLDKNLNIEKQSCRIETPLLTRLFNKKVYIINPDKIALLVKEKLIYSYYKDKVSNKEIKKDRYKYYCGNFFYSLGKINYVFEDFPKTIKLSRKSETVAKYNIMVVDYISDAQKVYIIDKFISPDAAEKFIISYLNYYKNNEDLTSFTEFLNKKPDALIAYLKKQLDERPVLINFHRAYQRLMERYYPETDIRKEYETMLNKEPDNSDLFYLLGRATDNPDERSKLYLKAGSMEKPSAYGLYGSAYYSISIGNFKEAYEYILKAKNLLPDNKDINSVYERVLLALGEYDKLLEIISEKRKKDPSYYYLAEDEVEYFAAKGDKDGALKAINTYANYIDTKMHGAKEYYETVLKCRYYYFIGDLKTTSEILLSKEQFQDTELFFVLAVSEGKYLEAATIFDKLKQKTPYKKLLVYLSAKSVGVDDVMDKYLNEAIEELKKEQKEDRLAAEYLEGKGESDPAGALKLILSADKKRIFLTCLGTKFPKHKDKYFPLAAKLNFSLSFPHHLIKKITEK